MTIATADPVTVESSKVARNDWRQGCLITVYHLFAKGALILQMRFEDKVLSQKDREGKRKWEKMETTWWCFVISLPESVQLNHIAVVTPHYPLSVKLLCKWNFHSIHFDCYPIVICQPQEPASWIPIWRPSIGKLPRVHLQLPRQALGLQPPPPGGQAPQLGGGDWSLHFFISDPTEARQRSVPSNWPDLLSKP